MELRIASVNTPPDDNLEPMDQSAGKSDYCPKIPSFPTSPMSNKLFLDRFFSFVIHQL